MKSCYSRPVPRGQTSGWRRNLHKRKRCWKAGCHFRILSFRRPDRRNRNSCRCSVAEQRACSVIVTGAVEGDLDEVLLRRLAGHVGIELGKVHGRNGKHPLLQNLRGYNLAARHAPWIVLVDLDRDCDCAPVCRGQWLPEPARFMYFRIAVRACESWFLADHERLADFLGISPTRLPRDPDGLDDPKRTLVDLARGSRKWIIREHLVPRAGSGRSVGPAYTSHMIEFANDACAGWRVDVAAERSPSLRKCLECLLRLRLDVA